MALEEKTRHAEETPRAPASAEPRTSGHASIVNFIGFNQTGGVVRVYVRLNQPSQFAIHSAGDKMLVLQLPNAKFGRGNDERRMDTSYFQGPVVAVTPRKGPDNSIEVEIQLKHKASYQTHRDDNEVMVEFPLTTGP
jgi:hypothetical protein